MKIKVDIILGFLKSGKTSLINLFLNSYELSNEKVVIVQFENGKTEIAFNKSHKNTVIKRKVQQGFDTEFLKDIIKDFAPQRIIIEYNGMADVHKFMEFFNNSYFNKLCEINRIINIIDAEKGGLYMLNMKDKLSADIMYSSLIIITNCEGAHKDIIKQLISYVKTNNDSAKIIKLKNLDDGKKYIHKGYLSLDAASEKMSIKEVLSSISIFICFITLAVLLVFLSTNTNSGRVLSLFNSFKINFISIIIESLPFILIGSFISSIIQIFVSDKWLSKLLNRNRIVSSISASIIGVLFPICDCGTIPIAMGFLQKGVPLSSVITFMLSAPIVNPISIMSTMYAFQSNKNVVIYRISLGIIIALIGGYILGKADTNKIVNLYTKECNCPLCNGTYYNAPLYKKIQGVFLSTGDEFIRVSSFMILGAVFSSVFQVLNSNDLLSYLPSNKVSYLLFMMITAFTLSVCSTSDAFIAKGFLNSVPLNSILGFLILGPMIDIKNTMMLRGYFNKSFLVRYICTICLITFVLLLIIPL